MTRSLSKDIYEAGKLLRQIQMDHHNGVYEGQTVSRDNVVKLRSSARHLTAWLDPRSAVDPETIQTITLSQRGNMFFATSEDEPTIFVAARTLENAKFMLGAILKGERTTPDVQ